MKQYAKGQGYNWLYLVDEKSTLADAFGANRTPECFLFDNTGKLVYHGAIDDNPSDASAVSRKHLTEAINEMKGGKHRFIDCLRTKVTVVAKCFIPVVPHWFPLRSLRPLRLCVEVFIQWATPR